MKNQTQEFAHLSNYLQQCCKRLHVTRDEIVRITGMCNDKASAVWNGKDVRLSYYLSVLKLLLKHSLNPRYKYPPQQLLDGLLHALWDELTASWVHSHILKIHSSWEIVCPLQEKGLSLYRYSRKHFQSVRFHHLLYGDDAGNYIFSYHPIACKRSKKECLQGRGNYFLNPASEPKHIRYCSSIKWTKHERNENCSCRHRLRRS